MRHHTEYIFECGIAASQAVVKAEDKLQQFLRDTVDGRGVVMAVTMAITHNPETIPDLRYSVTLIVVWGEPD